MKRQVCGWLIFAIALATIFVAGGYIESGLVLEGIMVTIVAFILSMITARIGGLDD